jgi:hypothetical protein
LATRRERILNKSLLARTVVWIGSIFFETFVCD